MRYYILLWKRIFASICWLRRPSELEVIKLVAWMRLSVLVACAFEPAH